MRIFYFLVVLCSSLSSFTFAQQPFNHTYDSRKDPRSLNQRMEDYDFQYLCLNDALKNPHPEKVYELYLYQCTEEYTSFPREILKFTNLRILVIRYPIKWLPKDINKLKKLEVLIVWGSLVGLPQELGELTNLWWLELPFNNLKKLPSSISKLKKLEVLHLGYNPMEEFPVFISQLPKLRYFAWFRNRCDIIPPEYKFFRGDYLYKGCDPKKSKKTKP